MITETSPTRNVSMGFPTRHWAYRWDITLTWRHPDDTGDGQHKTYLVAHTADELFEIVRRTSYDPRVVACTHSRHAELDMSYAPTGCPTCLEVFTELPPRQRWRECQCGGHMIYECVACGYPQHYPTLEPGCLNNAAG